MNFEGTKAIYLQIADFVCEQVLLKKWEKNEKIPSVRQLAVSLQVNPNTVARTYAFLEEKEIINTQRGVGYFVALDARKQALALKKEEFLKVHLPQVFKSMDLLDINLGQVKQLYEKRVR